ncbi:MAG: hypothetical protein K0R93_1402 [Anaerosolibacter sp.]|uniref:hypothetical protein n=1 Tax=Anaerosolibacter sp. TaxID=1872527 RepID=UPI00262CBE3F|nr:hypothetical protein [Anaerosolibacter sp.]MDF2546504.1 hypothetical protein [Anaerosolibacter sp.]
MEYDQTHTIGQSTIHIIVQENLTQDQIDGILNECYAIAREIIQAIQRESE